MCVNFECRLVKTRCRLNFLGKGLKFNSIIPRPFTNPFELCINLFKRKPVIGDKTTSSTGSSARRYTFSLYCILFLLICCSGRFLYSLSIKSFFFLFRQAYTYVCEHDFPSRIYILIKSYGSNIISLLVKGTVYRQTTYQYGLTVVNFIREKTDTINYNKTSR